MLFPRNFMYFYPLDYAAKCILLFELTDNFAYAAI